MEIIERKMPDNYVLVQFGDLHIGPKTCFTRGISRLVDRIASDPHCYAANIGDNVDSIVAGDKRYVADQIMSSVSTPGKQRNWIIQKFRPIAGKILAWGTGNHEMKLINTLDIGQEVADALGIPYGVYRYQLRMTDKKGKLMHKLFMTHGRSITRSQAKDPIQRKANYRASLRRLMESTGHTDCIYMGMGHTHCPDVVKPTIGQEIMLAERGGKIRQEYRVHNSQTANYIPPDARWYAVGGSFLRALTDSGSKTTSYAEIAMYKPVELGWLEIKVEDRQVVSVEKVVI